MSSISGGYYNPHIGKSFVDIFKENIERMAKEAAEKGHIIPERRVYRPEDYEYEGDEA